MAKIKGKGTVLQQTISAVLTAVAQLTSIEQTGAESETFDCTTLDTSGAGKEYSQTGYSEGGSVNFEGFYDPALAGHQAMTDLITTPAECNWKLIFSNSSEQAFTGAGISFDQTIEMDNGVTFSASVKCDQLPTFTT